jgi:hypothetical protein
VKREKLKVKSKVKSSKERQKESQKEKPKETARCLPGFDFLTLTFDF